MKKKVTIEVEKITAVICNLNRKLFLLEGERKSSKRREIIDSIIEGEDGEIKQLEKLLGISRK